MHQTEAKQKRVESRLLKVEKSLAEASHAVDEKMLEAIAVIERKEKHIH